MSDASNKLINSAHQLGVMLGIPMYVDPEKGFESEKVLKWENGDQVKVHAIWSDGAFYYTAYLGQIDPKTNEMAFISGEIAKANSLESLIGMVDGFLKDKAVERGDVGVAVDPDVTAPVEEPEVVPVEPEAVSAEPEAVPAVGLDDEPINVAVTLDPETPDEEIAVDDTEELLANYKDAYREYQDLLMDPEHDHSKVYGLSNALAGLEMRLREQGVNPKYIDK